MKILILQDDFPPDSQGGAGNVSAMIAGGYIAAGHEVVIVTAVREKKAAGSFFEKGLNIERIYSAYNTRWRAWRCLVNISVFPKLKSILDREKPDVVHAHNIHEHLSYWALVLAKKRGAKVFLTAHDVQMFHYRKLSNYVHYRINPLRQLWQEKWRYNPFRNWFIRHVIRQYKIGVIAVSRALRDALVENHIPVLTVIHNGIDPDAWRESPDSTRAFKEKFRIGERTILFSGGRSILKGEVQILKALVNVAKEVPDVQLLVVGHGPRNVVRVVSTGWIAGSDLHCAYHSAAVVVVPSICLDAFPTINLEAMACGKPIVATNLGGSSEAVKDGITGYIVDPFDTGEFAAKLIELLTDPAKRVAFGTAGAEQVCREFSLQRQIRNYLELFETTSA